MATMTITDGVFVASHTISNSNINPTFILNTQNKFVDKNINVKITTPVASGYSLSITDTPNTNLTLSATSTYYLVSGGVSGSVAASSGGWIQTGTAQNVSDNAVTFGRIAASTLSSTTVTPAVSSAQTVYITPGYYSTTRTVAVLGMSSGTQAAATVTATGAVSNVTLVNTASAQTGLTQITATPSITAPSSASATYFMAMTAGVGNTTITQTKAVGTTGYLGNANQITASGGTVTGKEVVYYVPLTSAAVTLSGTKAATTPTAADGGVSGAFTSSPTTTKPASGYFYSVKVTAPETTITPSKTVSTAGYLGDAGQISGSVKATTTSATYYIPITTGALKANAGSVSASSSNMSGSEVSTAPSGYYITVQGSGQVGVQTAGWVPTSLTQNSSVATKYFSVPTATFTLSANQVVVNTAGYIPKDQVVGTIGAGSLANSPTSGTTYTEQLSPAIDTADGYLYINPGYFTAQKISLGTLIPDATTATSVISTALLPGYEAFDEAGNRITGGMTIYDGTYSVS